MSLMIKGMDMPEYKDVFGDGRGCVYLLMLTVNKDGTASMQFNDVDGGFYRVKENPTPHGRLIDADRLLRKCQKISTQAWKMKLYANVEFTMNQFIDFVKQAPTIIKAED